MEKEKVALSHERSENLSDFTRAGNGVMGGCIVGETIHISSNNPRSRKEVGFVRFRSRYIIDWRNKLLPFIIFIVLFFFISFLVLVSSWSCVT